MEEKNKWRGAQQASSIAQAMGERKIHKTWFIVHASLDEFLGLPLKGVLLPRGGRPVDQGAGRLIPGFGSWQEPSGFIPLASLYR